MIAFGQLLGMIYDTILQPEAWADALHTIAAFVQTRSAVLIVEDAVNPADSLVHMAPSDPVMIARYVNGFMLINPMRLANVERVQVGDTILTQDFMSRRQYERTRFYREFLVSEGIADIAASVLDMSSTRIAVLSMHRSMAQGPADNDLRKRLELVAPHVKRAASISRVLEDTRIKASSMADMLDRLKGAVFLLDAGGTIVHVNAAAAQELKLGTVLRSVGGRLTPKLPAGGKALADGLAAAALGDPGMAGVPATIAFTTTETRKMIGIVIPLTGGVRQATSQHRRAVAALFVRQLTFETPAATGTLRQLYDLTPRETAVLVALVENGGVAETADVLGLSPLTVRTHLRSIHRKTGISRNADLVQLVGSLSTPFG